MSAKNAAIKFQADLHEMVHVEGFRTLEDYCLFLVHRKAYEEAAQITSNKTVLDLGCNNGYGTAILQAQCQEVIGVDISPKAIAEARQRFGQAGIEFRLVDGVQLPFEAERFEAVVSFQVIEHISDYAAYLSEIRRVLVPGGLALLATPNAEIRLDPGMKPWNPFHIREFTGAELKELLQSYFSQVTIRGLFAKEDLYRIELNRVQQRRQQARSWLGWIAGLRLIIGTRAYTTLINFVRTTGNRLGGWGKPAKQRPVYAQDYSITDLFYESGRFEEALDLMAICYR